MPRFTFEKFPGAEPLLTTSMKSVGEAMAIGRTFAESLQKALRSHGDRAHRLRRDRDRRRRRRRTRDAVAARAGQADARPAAGDRPGLPPRADRRRRSTPPASTSRGSCAQIREHRRGRGDGRARDGLPTDAPALAAAEADGLLRRAPRPSWPARPRRRSRRARRALGRAAGLQAHRHLRRRVRRRARPTCIHCYEGDGCRPAGVRGRADRPRARSSSSAAGRTGSARASSSTIAASTPPSRCARPAIETIMVNCNPETVSTDYDTSDRLYFEPLTAEDVIELVRVEQPQRRRCSGVIVQFGGQTPLKLAQALEARRHPDPRHLARRDRPGRGPRALPAAAAPARPAPAGQRHRHARRDEAEAIADTDRLSRS